jgi:hypothetical protein
MGSRRGNVTDVMGAPNREALGFLDGELLKSALRKLGKHGLRNPTHPEPIAILTA